MLNKCLLDVRPALQTADQHKRIVLARIVIILHIVYQDLYLIYENINDIPMYLVNTF